MYSVSAVKIKGSERDYAPTLNSDRKTLTASVNGLKPIIAKDSITHTDGKFKSSFEHGNKRSDRETPTETAAFRKWFGGSKVVDENGVPKVVYHGTNMIRIDVDEYIKKGVEPTGDVKFSLHDGNIIEDKNYAKQIDRIEDKNEYSYIANTLYLSENKKRIREWFQAHNGTCPLRGTKFGFIQSLSDYLENVNGSKANNGSEKAKYSDRDTQTETQAFRKWFGDSKVVDEDGKPKVVYHGTNEQFYAFDKNKFGSSTDMGDYGAGFYFDADKLWAGSYGGGAEPMAVYLSIKNPIMVEHGGDAQLFIDAFEKAGIEINFNTMRNGELMSAQDFVERWAYDNGAEWKKGFKDDSKGKLAFTQALRKAGYDGVMLSCCTLF